MLLDDTTIRLLASGDVDALQQFNAALSEQTRSRFLPHAYDSDTLARIIARAQSGIDRAYIALAGEVVVGYFFLWEIETPVPVLGLGLADAWQGRGLGRRFMEILIGDARIAGCSGIELTTLPENERAFALYRAMGFEHVGDADNVAGDGRVVRERVMFLPLVPGALAPQRAFGPPV
jgi:ribosomal protein S18 acetylase RimI-like enzyme